MSWIVGLPYFAFLGRVLNPPLPTSFHTALPGIGQIQPAVCLCFLQAEFLAENGVISVQQHLEAQVAFSFQCIHKLSGIKD